MKWDRIKAEMIRDRARRSVPQAEITVCHAAREALATLRMQPADFAVLGLALPDMDGVDLLQLLINEWPGTRVLVVSGRCDERSREILRQANIAGYFDSSHEPVSALPIVLRDVVQGGRYFSPLHPAESRSAAGVPLHRFLSPTELQVFAVIGEGADDVQAGARLGLSDQTVRTHRQHLMRKLRVQTSRELILAAIRYGVIRVLPDRILHPGLEGALAAREALAGGAQISERKSKQRPAVGGKDNSADYEL